MAFQFTEKQTKVLNARGHNVLVSAAAGSGKTAVLVERIIRMITEGPEPMDIDRILVVTFTRAAASQMRERIAEAISERLSQDPGNVHLQRQETLLACAQITTIDSFCTWLIRNHFSEIDLDPGFRQMDEAEAKLVQQDVLQKFLEQKYEQMEDSFRCCVDYFCNEMGDRELERMILTLYQAAVAHPDPLSWLAERRGDYEAVSREELLQMPWMQAMLRDTADKLRRIRRMYDRMIRECTLPGGPAAYHDFLIREREDIFGADGAGSLSSTGEADQADETDSSGQILPDYDMLRRMVSVSFSRIPSIKKNDTSVNPDQKERVQNLRDQAKKSIQKLQKGPMALSLDEIRRQHQVMEKPVAALADLTAEYLAAYQEEKKRKNVIDFVDLESYALQILLEKQEDGTWSDRRAAQSCQAYFREVMIDEYQDSNEIQELILCAVSGEATGHYRRFMVGDVKQSIYRFRLARPEIFIDKFGTYPVLEKGDAAAPEKERIDLDQNFRSRTEVLDSVNDVFMRIMRSEIGGVEYDDTVSLKKGAEYPDTAADYTTELLLVSDVQMDQQTPDGDGTGAGRAPSGDPDESGSGTDIQAAGEGDYQEIAELGSRRKEALAAAGRIRELVGHFPVKDGKTGEVRPARYSDIVILLRSAAGWNEEFREVLEKEGIPVYVTSRTGYFAAEEIRQVLQLLQVLNNPCQDIPLYGVMRGYFGRFTQNEIADIRIFAKRTGEKDGLLYDAVAGLAERQADAALPAAQAALAGKCAQFLDKILRWRSKVSILTIRELLTWLMKETGYEAYVSALPAGSQRSANLRMLMVQAANFEQTSYTGLFRFLRYIGQMTEAGVDYGEANTLDENADVVRIMTIHKSKGLEFPICLVCGLAKKYSIGTDTSGSLICDTDLGLGVDYYDERIRCKVKTLRGNAVAAKIRRDALGEELRVLYVAMTRAKEKLILTGYVKDEAAYRAGIEMKLSGAELNAEDPHLPAALIDGTNCYLDLVMLAAASAGGFSSLKEISIQTSDLVLSEMEEQLTLQERKARLTGLESAGIQDLPRPETARQLDLLFSYRYPHENLAGLYTKTTVTELKKASMEAVYAEQDGALQGMREPDIPPLLPRFILEKQAEEAGKKESSLALSGAERGTAVHRIFELLDYERLAGTQAGEKAGEKAGETASGETADAESYERWLAELTDAGTIPASYAEAADARLMLPFLQSDLGKRMGAAAERGTLKREQPFVLGLPASELQSSFPEEEIILIQGIIDAFFIEEDEIVLVDYKTDRVKTETELAERYHVQLDYYEKALTRMLKLPVKEKIIWSTQLQKAIRL